MTRDEAIERLAFHAGRDPRIDDPRWKRGFLPSLRPFDGTLKRDQMDDVIRCVLSLANEFESETLPRLLMNDLWAIVHLGRLWGVEKDGMLRRNNLISDDDVKSLDRWLESLSFGILFLLDGAPEGGRDALERALRQNQPS